MAHNNLGSLLIAEDRLQEAEAELREAILDQPSLSQSYLNLAKTFQVQGKLNPALENYGAAFNLGADPVRCLQGAGEVQGDLGHGPIAETYFRKALQQAPNDASIHRDLAILFQKFGRPDAAIVEYQEVLRLSPHDPRAESELRQAQAALTPHKR
jgi:Flp pilus assembly protein TadD